MVIKIKTTTVIEPDIRKEKTMKSANISGLNLLVYLNNKPQNPVRREDN